MPNLLKVLGFSLTLALFFTLVTHLLPQVEGEAPPEEAVDLSKMTMSDFVALGESVFKGKGTCTLCHNEMGRAPNILAEDVVAAAKQRMADGRYHGAAHDAEGYIRESMLEPSKYVVAGFGQKGSNDTESPMPEVDKAPIGLSASEMDAVIAFLESKDGNPVTVALPTAEAADPAAKTATAATVPAPAASGEEVLRKYNCTACHRVLDSEAAVGPDLHHVGGRLTPAQIRESILDPTAVIAVGFPPAMPPNIADAMSVAELKLVVDFLVAQK